MNGKQFQIGQHYMWTCWFSGGQSFYKVKDRTEDRVLFAEYRREADGDYELTTEYEIRTDKNGDEYIKMCEYHGEEGRLYAEM